MVNGLMFAPIIGYCIIFYYYLQMSISSDHYHIEKRFAICSITY